MATTRISGLSLALLAGVALVTVSHLSAFVAPTPPRANLPQTRALRAQLSAVEPAASSATSSYSFAGAAVAASLLTFVVSGSRASLAARRVSSGSPSLLQLLEQKKLLSTVQNLRLLSTAEAAGLGGSTLEKLGLLKLAQDTKILSTAETVVTDGKTPLLLLAAGSALLYATYLDLTTLPSDFTQGFVAGLLGLPGITLVLAGLAIGALTLGARRTADISLTEKTVELLPGSNQAGSKAFDYKEATRDQTLIQTLEDKQLLGLAEDLKLLTLAESVVRKPLTFAERTGILSTLEGAGLLSLVESLAAKKSVAGTLGVGGLTLLIAALPVGILAGIIPALLLVLGGLVLVGGGLAFSVVQAPEKSVR
mmetsp:Transcript_47738/g.111322  ORF Transcript_47738/g.111322 Transcript_47738/m.111322 type:complete len:366 (+) Transcript_47738:59-1156(+)